MKSQKKNIKLRNYSRISIKYTQISLAKKQDYLYNESVKYIKRSGYYEHNNYRKRTGKSAFALNLMNDLASKYKCLYFNVVKWYL